MKQTIVFPFISSLSDDKEWKIDTEPNLEDAKEKLTAFFTCLCHEYVSVIYGKTVYFTVLGLLSKNLFFYKRKFSGGQTTLPPLPCSIKV